MALAAPSRPASAPSSSTDCSETDSARRGGGPQDRALYECSCGAAFTASVSTSVGCPVCGADQAW